jgi:hypothetical protein
VIFADYAGNLSSLLQMLDFCSGAFGALHARNPGYQVAATNVRWQFVWYKNSLREFLYDLH